VSNPEETPAQAIERLRKEIAGLRRLRAQVPMMILEPHVEDATKHIKEVAARLTVKAEIPASAAIEVLRSAQEEETKPAAAPTPPPTVPSPGSTVTVAATGKKAVVVTGLSTGVRRSPEEWEVTVLTEDGELLTVKPEEVAAAPVEGAPVTPTKPAAISPGARVRDKTTGQTGYVSEVAEDKATVALDQGGFIVRLLPDLEPL